MKKLFLLFVTAVLTFSIGFAQTNKDESKLQAKSVQLMTKLNELKLKQVELDTIVSISRNELATITAEVNDARKNSDEAKKDLMKSSSKVDQGKKEAKQASKDAKVAEKATAQYVKVAKKQSKQQDKLNSAIKNAENNRKKMNKTQIQLDKVNLKLNKVSETINNQ
ncbi:MAG: hypothetical protein IT246_03850 [Bacteroidia bacterium]|nr:hypothetical protein [Bacteroidia bacterium]MCZ2139981.1 hypothetical protein [Bacteroidia bacterium]